MFPVPRTCQRSRLCLHPLRTLSRGGERIGGKNMANPTTEVHGNEATGDASVARIDTKLETVVVPVSDVDRAKEFYGRLGWRLDRDFASDNGFRVVQFTPPGSGCSVQFGTKLTS